MPFSNRIRLLTSIVLTDMYLNDAQMPVLDSLGQGFLDYVKDGMTITVCEDGIVRVE